MLPNFFSLQQITRNTIQCQSSRTLDKIPIKQPQNLSTIIKRIRNYSYALNSQIGLGLTSRVYKGQNDLTGQPVAIKRIELKNQNDLLSQEFLQQQITTLQKINQTHARHLISLQQIILTSNNLYIITQYCEGKDMGKILRQRKKLPQKQAQLIMKQMILGLIHRDLKLSNLFVTKGQIKLADFGFAINQEKCHFGFTYNVGSPKYMPPETLKFNKYSFFSDVWAMGIIAYELVYGVSPWQNKDDAQLFEQITSTPISNLFDPTIPISNHYKTFIVHCLQPNISQRANPHIIFNYPWPLSDNFVQGYQQQIKIHEVIKLPGKNYAVFNSSNQVSYQTKQLDITDFSANPSQPTQFVLLSLLNYCRFMANISQCLRSLSKQNNYLLITLNQQIALSIQILMKSLGQVACLQRNKFDTVDFNDYIHTGDWQNLKQIIVRYDIEFRAQFHQNQSPKKGSIMPKTPILFQTIYQLKSRLPQNVRLVDKLISYLQIRQIFLSYKPIQFASRSNIINITKQALIPDNPINCQNAMRRLGQRLIILRI